jgi:hypothetical protein
MSIYLTATECRPACVPFDQDLTRDAQYFNEFYNNPKLLNKLSKIKEIRIFHGPYYDSHNKIVIANTLLLDKTSKILANIRKNRENNKPVHILMGKLLGYVCPLNLEEKGFYDKEYYSVEFEIRDNQTTKSPRYLGCWCPIDNTRGIVKASKLLIKIQNVLDPLKKHAELIIDIVMP